ncbi:MAG TPA: hypothetical protein PK649_01890 [Vicingus sp.]|nr:hypothetical protein [Vicingus sp.]HRP59907.1 hypothetical protein [Vicingus sp.]
MRSIVFIIALICAIIFAVYPILTMIFRIGDSEVVPNWWQETLGAIGVILVVALWNGGNIDGKKDASK